MKKTLSLAIQSPATHFRYYLPYFFLFVILLDAIQGTLGSEVGMCSDVALPILLLKPDHGTRCIATLYNKDSSNLDFSFWITASECCDARNLFLENNNDKIPFITDHVGPFLCIGHTLPVPIHGYDLSDITSIAPDTELQKGSIKNTFNPLPNPQWLDTSKTLFFLNGITAREKSGTPVFIKNKLLGILTKQFMKKNYFAGTHPKSLPQQYHPDPIEISFNTGFNGSFYNFRETPHAYIASRYFFNNSIGTQVFYYDYKAYHNTTITIGRSREWLADNRTVERINVTENGNCYHADIHQLISADGIPDRPKRNHLWCHNGTESFMFQHQSPILKLKSKEGSCQAFKVDDPSINYPGRSYFVTAGHCISKSSAKSYLISEYDKRLNATLFSLEYFESDWAILVTDPTDGPGFPLTNDQTVLPPGTLISHKRLKHRDTTHRVSSHGINLSHPLLGIYGLEALPGASGSPLLQNDQVFGIQSWAVGKQSMLASQLPPRSAFKKAIRRQWEALDLPINKFAYFDNGGQLNLTGFSIDGTIRQAAFRTLFIDKTTYVSKNWKRFGYHKMEAEAHSISSETTFKRFLNYESWQNHTRDTAKYFFQTFEGYNVTLRNYIETDTWLNASRKIIKFDNGRIMDIVNYSKNKQTDTRTHQFTQEKLNATKYLYFKNTVQVGNDIVSWEPSSASEFDKNAEKFV